MSVPIPGILDATQLRFEDGPRVYPAVGHPENVVAAPVGSLCLSRNGRNYRKLFGGNTPRGWYEMPDGITRRAYQGGIGATHSATLLYLNDGMYGTIGGAGSTPAFNDSGPQWGSPAAINPRDQVMCGVTTSVNNTSYVSSSGLIWIEEQFDMTFFIRTTTSSLQQSMWAGIFEPSLAIPIPPGGTNQKVCAFRYHEDVDTEWTAVVQPSGVGHTRTEVALGTTVATSEQYRLRMRSYFETLNDSTTLVIEWSVNESVPYVMTFASTVSAGSPPYDMPVAVASGMAMRCGMINTNAGVGGSVWFEGWSMIRDSSVNRILA